MKASWRSWSMTYPINDPKGFPCNKTRREPLLVCTLYGKVLQYDQGSGPKTAEGGRSYVIGFPINIRDAEDFIDAKMEREK